jgi:hypothetical protein
MLATIAVLSFVALDVAAVIGALLWLSEQRARQDRARTRQPDRRI